MPPRNMFWRRGRYGVTFLIWLALIWVPVFLYLTTTPPAYKSTLALILPGSGASSSVNLDSIGQASSYASSAFSSSSVSPTQTYKRLIRADRIRSAAAQSLGEKAGDFPRPDVELVDQTGFIQVELGGPDPQTAQARLAAILQAFQAELDRLRADEMLAREQSAVSAITEYQASVAATRGEIGQLQRDTGFLSRDQFAAHVEANDALRARVEQAAALLADRAGYVGALEQTLQISAPVASQVLTLYSDTVYLSLTQDLSEKAALLSGARAQYGERHPQVIEALAQHERSRVAVFERVRARTGLSDAEIALLDLSEDGARTGLLGELVRSDAERRGASAEYEALNARYQEERLRLTDIAPAAARLEDLQRDFRVSEAVFASAIARGESSKVDVYASYPLVQVLEDPSLPERPSSPRKKIALAGGVAATFFVIVALVLGWMRFRMIGWLVARRDGPADRAGA